jgi:hypothetical protein
MQFFNTLTLATLASIALALPNPSKPAASSYQIRSDQDPVYHLYLQALPGSGKKAHPNSNLNIEMLTNHPASTPVLGPASSGDNYTIGSTIQSVTTKQYLNINTASTSYKPLSFGSSANTTAWGLEGDTIITVQGSTYGRRKFC